MNVVFFVFLGILGVFAVMAWMTVWSRRDTVMRHIAVVVFLLAIPGLAAAAVTSLGWNKPVALAPELSGDHQVLGSKMVEGEGIYLYLDVPDSEPRAAILPWDEQLASKLQDLLDDPENEGGVLLRYEWSWDSHKPQFHPAPPPVMPMPKGPPPPDPERYERAA